VDSGTIVWQSRLIRSEKRARSYAAMLQANRHYSGAEVVPSAKTLGFRVRFLPSAEDRRLAMYEALSSIQFARAVAQVDEYAVGIVSDTASVVTGPTQVRKGIAPYRVTQDAATGQVSCTCPHFVHRLAGSGVVCKHAVVVAMRRAEIADELRGAAAAAAAATGAERELVAV